MARIRAVRIFVCLVALSVVFIVVHFTNEERRYKICRDSSNSQLHETSNFDMSHQGYCKNILKHMCYGRWRKRLALTATDENYRLETNLLLRKYRGLPGKLEREDLHCGTNFPIAAPTFGPSLPATCSPTSEKPCCNDVTGLCGNATKDCACAKCTDFRDIISPEICEWVPAEENCQIKNYTSEEACEVVSNRLSSLTLIGDSLIRHFHNALMLLFTNDLEHGAMHRNMSLEEKINCFGERQFVDSGRGMCHGKLARDRDDTTKEKFCKGNPYFLYKFNESYCLQYKDMALGVVRENLGKPNSLIVLGIGIHDRLDAQRVMGNYVEPMLQLIGGGDWPRLLWVTTHAHGFLKPMAFRSSQGNENILPFNRRMREFLEPRGVAVFDVFNMTSGVFSYDGTHYGLGLNMMKARMLISYIEEAFVSKRRGN